MSIIVTGIQMPNTNLYPNTLKKQKKNIKADTDKKFMLKSHFILKGRVTLSKILQPLSIFLYEEEW